MRRANAAATARKPFAPRSEEKEGGAQRRMRGNATFKELARALLNLTSQRRPSPRHSPRFAGEGGASALLGSDFQRVFQLFQPVELLLRHAFLLFAGVREILLGVLDFAAETIRAEFVDRNGGLGQ